MKIVFFIIAGIGISLLAFIFVSLLYLWIKKQPSDNQKIADVGKLIRKGAMTFLKKEYIILSKFAGVVCLVIFVFLPSPLWTVISNGTFLSTLDDRILVIVAYIAGTAFSCVAGYVGIYIATLANVKTAEAAKTGIKPSFLCGFRGGAVMGLAVVGASLLGIGLAYLIFMQTHDTSLLLGFSFGASSLALFAKAGGGIFTKTADISADLFDSNVASMTAALVMAASLNESKNVMMIFCYASIGLLASIIGIIFARMGKKGGPTFALNMSTYITTALFLGLSALATFLFKFQWRIWGASTLGLLVGVLIGIVTDYFTNDTKKPVKNVASASKSGPAFTILSGVSYGFLSVLPAMVGIAVSALGAYKLCAPIADQYGLSEIQYGMFGISMAAVGMLSIVGMIISNDAYGPIVDNARGLAEMGNLGDEVLERTDTLDSAGNTVKAITKGFAICAAGLTVVALLGAFMTQINTAMPAGKELITGFNVTDPIVFFGLMIGAAVPAVFSALQILGVDRNAQRMVKEIHRQFDEIPGLKEGKEGVTPEYDKCISIATHGAIRELIPAGLFAIIITLAVGFVGGVEAIGGFLTGNIVSGLLLALFMSNSGGLWDNSKKYVEAGNEGGKGSEAHKAAIVGDTVGDPFKDTSGPSINTQITVVSLISTLMGSVFLTTNLLDLL